jgi:cytidylate kinase
MHNMLLKYLNARLEPKSVKSIVPGPVITISRECGCSGRLVAKILTEKINKKYKEEGKHVEWKWIGKEVLSLASHELRMQPQKIRSLFEAHEKNYFEEIVSSFTESYYGQNEMVKKVIGDVIRKIAVDGYIIIVGRGSCAITRDIQKSLHINLEAPLSWKAARISQKNGISLTEARKHVMEVDKQRYNFRDHYRGKNNDDNCFDLSFNCKHFTSEEIADITLKIADLRHIL